MWAISCYFNPCGYSTKLPNFKRFRESLKHQGVKLLLVELAFGDDPFVIPDDGVEQLIRLRSDCVLFQKERLLNIALEALPPCNIFSWLDCDVIFENDRWPDEADRLLDQVPVVQLFNRANMLDSTGAIGEWQNGAAYEKTLSPMKRAMPQYELGGAIGYGWAARTELFKKHGFYDRNIIGGGDTIMAWAMYGYDTWPGRGIGGIFTEPHLIDIENWSMRFYNGVRGRVGCVPGVVNHLWHGMTADRRYLDRHKILVEEHFDPVRDIRIGSNGCWEWASDKPEMHRRVREYFWGRRE